MKTVEGITLAYETRQKIYTALRISQMELLKMFFMVPLP